MFVVDNAVVVASFSTVIVDGILTLSSCLPPVMLVSHCSSLKGQLRVWPPQCLRDLNTKFVYVNIREHLL